MKTLNAPTNLKCEYAVNPIGIDAVRPRLFWQMDDSRRGARQTAYQVIAGSEPGEADLWDSGRVESSECTQIEYSGARLTSRQRAYWRVRIWDQDKMETPWSSVSFFEMGLLDRSDWRGEWIALDEKTHAIPSPASYLRNTFELTEPVADARLYITARGVYIPYLNGERIGQDRLTPGWTDYNIRIRYQAYDVTEQLRKGENAIGVALGDGWFAGDMTWQDKKAIYGDRPWLLAQLHIRLASGREIVIATDDTWTASNRGPITSQSFLHGDTIDAGISWDFTSPDFPEKGWKVVASRPLDSVKLIAQVGPTVQKTDELPTLEMWKLANGDWVFDLGQNMVGVVRLKLRGKAGQQITLHHGEFLNSADRSVYLTNLRSAKATDRFILSGGKDVLEPQFTLHGFRYVQVSGLKEKPARDAVTGIVYHSGTRPTGSFACSNAKLNKLQHNIVWGQKGNFVEVPTDCPQRDERLGWMGDAQVFVRTATFNMDVAGFFSRWMLDVADAQLPDGSYTDVVPDILSGRKMNQWGSGAPAWEDAGVICPWTIYLAYGDKRILENQYESMCRYIDYLDRRCENGLHPDFGYGDWLAIGSHTDKQLIGTAYSAYSISLMRKIAHLLGQSADERRFGMLFDKFKAAFNREFVTPAGRLASASQTAAILALRFDMLDEPIRTRVAKWLANDITSKGVLTTGFVGCNLILPTLSQIGRDDLAWMLLSSEKFPSWLFSVNQGATTIWERWDGWTPEKGFQDAGMNSFNHYAYGSCGQWMYARIGGIDLDEQEPGYRRIVIDPVMAKGLSSGKGSLQTLYGETAVEWKLSGTKFTMKVTVPPNSSAIVRLPGGYSDGDIDESMIRGRADGRTTIELPAGTYRMASMI